MLLSHADYMKSYFRVMSWLLVVYECTSYFWFILVAKALYCRYELGVKIELVFISVATHIMSLINTSKIQNAFSSL